MRRALILATIETLCSCSDGSAGDQVTRQSQSANVEVLDDAKVKAMSRALFDAYDRADEPAVAGALGANFVWIDNGVQRRDDVLKRVRGRTTRGAPAWTRSYEEESVWSSEGAAVFLGRTVEHFPIDGAMPTGDFEGWSTLVWAREDGAWKAVSLQWVKAGLEAEREQWNAVYRERQRVPARPNQLLVETVKGHPPGRALDVGMGQGRNAIFLASQGWKVTGIDISDEGLRQAREAAAARGLEVETINAVFVERVGDMGAFTRVVQRDVDRDGGNRAWETRAAFSLLAAILEDGDEGARAEFLEQQPEASAHLPGDRQRGIAIGPSQTSR